MSTNTDNSIRENTSGGAVASHIGWSLLRTWGERVTTLLVFVILARLLPPSDIGALAYLTVITGIMQVIADGALSEWLIRNPDSNRGQETAIFTLQLSLSIFLALAVGISGWFWAPAAISRPDGGLVVSVMAVVIPLGCATKVPETLLRRNFKFKQIAYRSLIAYAVGGVVGISAALSGLGIWSLVLKQVCEAVLIFLLTIRAARWLPAISFDFSRAKSAVRFAAGVFGSWLLEAFFLRVDSFIVGTFLGSAALGFYSVALRISQILVDAFVAVISRVSISHFSALKDDPPAFSGLYVRMLKLTTRLFAPGIAVLAGVAPLLIPVVFGAKWALAAQPLQILCFVPFTMTATCYGYSVFLARGEMAKNVLINFIGACVTTVGALIGCSFGIIGVAIGVSSRMLVITPMVFSMTKRHTEVSMHRLFLIMWPALTGSAAGLVASALLTAASVPLPLALHLVITGVIGLVFAYGGLVLTLGNERRTYISQIIHVIRNGLQNVSV